MSVQIICRCGSLVDVVNKTVAAHKDEAGIFCDRSGARYVPSPRVVPSGVISPTGRQMELVAATEIPCPRCDDHPIAIAALFRETGPKVSDATLSEKYPEWNGPITSSVN